jgi:hypothetical protein
MQLLKDMIVVEVHEAKGRATASANKSLDWSSFKVSRVAAKEN